jgi:hypothetical protein
MAGGRVAAPTNDALVFAGLLDGFGSLALGFGFAGRFGLAGLLSGLRGFGLPRLLGLRPALRLPFFLRASAAAASALRVRSATRATAASASAFNFVCAGLGLV